MRPGVQPAPAGQANGRARCHLCTRFRRRIHSPAHPGAGEPLRLAWPVPGNETPREGGRNASPRACEFRGGPGAVARRAAAVCGRRRGAGSVVGSGSLSCCRPGEHCCFGSELDPSGPGSPSAWHGWGVDGLRRGHRHRRPIRRTGLAAPGPGTVPPGPIKSRRPARPPEPTRRWPTTRPPAPPCCSAATPAAAGSPSVTHGPGTAPPGPSNHPATHPARMAGASMAYDAATGSVVLFGGARPRAAPSVTHGPGTAPPGPSNHPATHPARMAGASMAYDAATGSVVLFGGATTAGRALSGTWTWDGTTWTHQSPAASPPARYVTSMAYDAATSSDVLFGGTTTANPAWGHLDLEWLHLGQAVPGGQPARPVRGLDGLRRGHQHRRAVRRQGYQRNLPC